MNRTDRLNAPRKIWTLDNIFLGTIQKAPEGWDALPYNGSSLGCFKTKRQAIGALYRAENIHDDHFNPAALGERPVGCSKGCTGRMCRDALNCDGKRT